MIRKSIVILGTIGVLLLFFVGIPTVLGALKEEPERKEAVARVPAAFVEEVAYEPLQLSVFAQGEVRPRREIALTTQVGGRIVEVSDAFADGGVIREGEVLVRLEDADYRSALARADARVATARQALRVEEAESELAARDYRELSGGEGDPSALALRQPQLARAKAEYDAALADLADAKLAVERTRIRAPFDGRVRSISADIGQAVNPGSPIGRIFSTDVAEVRLPLTDADLARLSLPFAFEASVGEGPEVRLSAQAAGKERQWTGHIVRTDAAIDPTTRQIAAIVQVPDPYGAGADRTDAAEGEPGFPLAVGLYVTAEIEGPTLDRAVVLPRLAVQDGGTDGTFVFTLNDEDELVRTQVSVAAVVPDGAVVTDGLEEGVRVLVSRPPTAVGQKVRPLAPGEDATPPPSEDEEEAGDDEENAEGGEGRRRRRGGGQSGAGR